MRRYACRRNGGVLSSIKHVVGTTSGCFYPRSNNWEVGGRPQRDKCGCRVRNCSQHRFTTLETISNYRNSYPGFSSGRPRGTTPADDRYIVLQARRNRRQTAGEFATLTTEATGRPISRFTVARRLHGGGLFARRPVRCVPLTPTHRRRRSLWCPKHRNWRDNEWGRVLFTDGSRFSLSSDSHRILIWREWGSRKHPSNIIERDRGAMGLQFLFMDDNAPCHLTVVAEQLLESRRLAARTLPPVTIRELRLALNEQVVLRLAGRIIGLPDSGMYGMLMGSNEDFGIRDISFFSSRPLSRISVATGRIRHVTGNFQNVMTSTQRHCQAC
ncbi:transposable element Tcb1 transposase [Trichonephila clavipes]|nr:transposable element Tcb1 transposase [Trichonephila clavipes]